MDDLGFNGTGSKFNTRFGSNSNVFGKQLNDLASGVNAGLPQPGVGGGQSVSFTAGGALFSPIDETLGAALYVPQQFECKVVTTGEPPEEGYEDEREHFVQIASGTIQATGTVFPLLNQAVPLGQDSTFFPCQQRHLFDVAIQPKDSRVAGVYPLENPWMNGNGMWKLDHTKFTKYYITVQFLDLDDNTFQFYPAEKILQPHEPFVSIVGDSGNSHLAVFSENWPGTWLTFTYLGAPAPFEDGVQSPPDSRGYGYAQPYSYGYGMTIIARLNWDDVNYVWKLKQEHVGPLCISIPYFERNRFESTNKPEQQVIDTILQNQLDDKFMTTIYNSYIVNRFKNAQLQVDSFVLPLGQEWWYDPKSL